MTNPATPLLGKTFGYLTVIRRAGSRPQKSGKSPRATWWVRCVCGTEIIMLSGSLTSKTRGALKSCGCRRGEMLVQAWNSHGMGDHPAHRSWCGMRARCTNPENKDWKNYGGRGITVCDAWLKSFRVFWEDMGGSYQSGLTIDRIDVNGNYEKTNCRWATPEVQSNNKRRHVIIPTPNGPMTVARAARKFDLKPGTIYARVRRHWTGRHLLKAP